MGEKCPMKSLVTLLIVSSCFLVSSCFSLDTNQLLRNSYTPDRSGDVFLVNDIQGVTDGSSTVLLSSRRLPHDHNMHSVNDILLCDFAAHHLGIEVETESVSELDSMMVESDNIFSKSRASVSFVIDGIGLSEVPRESLITNTLVSHDIKATSAFQDEISLLTSIITGTHVSVHGITARNWYRSNGDIVDAFSSPTSYNKAVNLPDRLLESTGGNSLVLSASADFELASAMATHPLLFADNPSWKTYGVYLDQKSKSFDSIYHHGSFDPVFMFDKNDIGRFSSLSARTDLFSIQRGGGTMLIRVGDVSARFSESNAKDYAFLAEMEFILGVVEGLRDQPQLTSLVKDDFPDYFSFAISSVRHFKGYGLKSDKFVTSFRVADAIIDYALGQLEQMYGSNLFRQVILLDQSDVTSATNDVINKVASELSDDVVVYGTSMFSLSSSNDICNKLNANLKKSQVTAFCPIDLTPVVQHPRRSLEPQQQKRQQPRRSNPKPKGDNLKAVGYLPMSTLVTFHLVFWITIAMGLAALYAASTLGSVAIPANSPLIRQLPNIYASNQVLREL